MADLNYSIAPVNPMPGMMQSLQLGQTLGGIRDQRAMLLAKEQAAQEEARLKAEHDAQVAAAYELVKKSPTGENYAALASLQPPAIAESTRKNFSMLDEDTQKKTLRESAEVYSAFNSGNIELALEKLKQKAEAYKNAGNKKGLEDTQRLIDMASMGEAGAKGVEKFFGLMISQMPGGKDAIDAVAKFGDEQRAAAAEPTVQKKRLVDIGFTEAQTNKALAEARKLGIESDKLLLEIENGKNKLPKTDISADAEKLVNNSVMAAAKANSLVKQYSTLSSDFEKAISTAGVGARFSEQVNKILGTEKQPTALRQEYLRMRNTAVLGMLPPGVASDKDIELALAAFPTETSSPANISGFLRGMAKLQAYEAAVESSKAEWIQQNGTLGTARTPMQVGNREVPKGARFTEFIQNYIPNTSVIGTGGTNGANYGSVPGKPSPAIQPVVEADF